MDNTARRDIGWCVEQLLSGKRLCREGWNGEHQYIELQVPDEYSKMTLPYVYLRTSHGGLVPWQASQGDLLSDDWRVAEPIHPADAARHVANAVDEQLGGVNCHGLTENELLALEDLRSATARAANPTDLEVSVARNLGHIVHAARARVGASSS